MKGILFKPWKIVYIAEHPDIEIQTRRLGGLKLVNDHEPDCWELSPANNDKPPFRFRDKRENIPHNERYFPIECKPRYQQGETVYIKEVWATDYRFNHLKPSELLDNVPKEYHNHGVVYLADGWLETGFKVAKVRSPLHLPEWAARYFITITDVRAERLQEITNEDAQLEGFEPVYETKEGLVTIKVMMSEARAVFRTLWNSINKDYPWESNCWVWVYTLRREK